MSKFRQHFFVCTNTRPPFAKPSCGPQKSNQILALLKEQVEKQDLKSEVRICASSCLGPCEEGPMIVVYPEATWYRGVKPEDISEIVEQHIIKGKAVERLRYQWPEQH